MSDDGRLRRTGIVAALGHVVAIYLAARLAPRALDNTASLETATDDGLVAVEMWLDAQPVTHERESSTNEETQSEPVAPAKATSAGASAARGGGARSGAGSAEGGGDTPPGPAEVGDGFSPIDEPPWDPRLRLSDVVDMSREGPPAPTRPPPSQRVVTAEDTNEAVRSIIRDEDKKLGLGNQHETVIAAAVQEAGRASGVPSGTHFVVSLVVDGDGNVTDATIRGDTAGDRAWPTTLAAIRGKLLKPLPLGIDERGKGARVTVDATLLHVYPSGGDKAVVMGDCPKMPLIGGEQAPHFMNIGGEQYLEPPHGLCTLSDGGSESQKTIVVRTKVKTHHAREAPPVFSSFAPRPKPKKLLPTPMELIMRAINGK